MRTPVRNRKQMLRAFCAVLCVALTEQSAQAAQVINYISCLGQAIQHSYDTTIARAQASQYKADKRAARADYYPVVTAFGATEFDKGLNNSAVPVFSVANTTLNAITRIQDLMAFQANWTLMDFGARQFNVKAASKSYEAAMLGVDTAVRDLKLQVLDAYRQALTSYKLLHARQQAVALYEALYEIKKRTYEAGTATRVELGEQSLQLAQAQDGVKEARQNLTDDLRELSSLTHCVYDADSINLLDFGIEQQAEARFFAPELTPDYRKYALQIAAKQAEIHSLVAQRFPRVYFYAGYNLYGTDKNNVNGALQNFSSRLANGGVAIQWTVFDGFKNAAQRQRKYGEIAELKAERDKKVWQLRSEYEKAHADLNPLKAQLETKAVVINRAENKVDMYQRLANKEVIDKTDLLKQQAQLIEQKLAADKVKIQADFSQEKLRILTGG